MIFKRVLVHIKKAGDRHSPKLVNEFQYTSVSNFVNLFFVFLCVCSYVSFPWTKSFISSCRTYMIFSEELAHFHWLPILASLFCCIGLYWRNLPCVSSFFVSFPSSVSAVYSPHIVCIKKWYQINVRSAVYTLRKLSH